MEPWWVTKEMASAAHTYSKPVLAAEAFTSRAWNGKWQNHPFRFKPLGDQMFTLGVNRFVIHRYAMQPWLNRWPGMTMGLTASTLNALSPGGNNQRLGSHTWRAASTCSSRALRRRCGVRRERTRAQ
jgi:hypothetical protein